MAEHYLGLMSGTSVDAVDAVLMDLSGPARVVAQSRCEFPPELRRAIWALFDSGPDEIERAAAVDNGLARLYARAAKLGREFAAGLGNYPRRPAQVH
jgi:anhydro-N-acetylmuramic acid kinase